MPIMGVSLGMPGNGTPKLIYAFSKARFFSAFGEGIILFWDNHPVAVFPNLEAAGNYAYNEFAGPEYTGPYSENFQPWLD